jgi:hypothetical protein
MIWTKYVSVRISENSLTHKIRDLKTSLGLDA